MPFKIFSEISKATKGVKDSLGAADVMGHLRESKTNILDKIDDVFHIGGSDIVDGINELTHEGEVEVTIYTTYGYSQNGKWIIPMRGRVHQTRQLPDHVIAGLVAKRINCEQPDLDLIISRSREFTDDSRSGQSVTLEFDSDPDKEQYGFPKSDFNGLIEREVELSEETARKLLEAQGATEWLSFSIVSDGHRGSGQVRLIAPEGLSVVTDIDDTIKVTLVPGDKDQVLRRTLCQKFESANGMAQKYRDEWSDAAFHYVSGGPWQLYRVLDEYLVKGEGGFPNGSFHLTYHPKNFLAEDTREILIEAVVGSLGRTFNHKVTEISKLMRRFPSRRFIFVGDSGEVDPEVYRHIKEQDEFRDRVEAIWIRDVLNDNKFNSYRLEGMNVIEVEPVVCATIHHYQKLSMRLQEIYNRPYWKNESPPCD
jgi:hypothetical protein